MDDHARDKMLARWDATLGAGAAGFDPDCTVKPALPSDDATLIPSPSARAGTGPSPTPSAASQPAPMAPQALQASGGTYRLVDVLGQGGMGVVYRAIQPGLDRQVAIKKSLAEPGPGRAQFLAEALITSRLEHPNIVPVYDLIATPEGDCALALKQVRGTSWKDLLHPREGQPARELEFHLGVLLSVANAVAFAHSRQIVHNDLKPENVMVGEFDEVLVMDWGIAVDVAPEPAPGSPVPHRSRLLGPCGTPSYVPPELALGEGDAIGPWTDTYLMGAILFEIVAGTPPYRRPSLHETLLAAASSEASPLPPSVPDGLRKLIARAMSPRREDRFADASLFRQALAEYLRSRESLTLSSTARRQLDQARASARAPSAAGERDRGYLELAEAGAGFRQALVLWSDNAEARAGAQEASVLLAERALANGDLGLASSELDRLQGAPQAERLAEAVAAARAVRQRSERSALVARRAIIGLTCLVILVLGAGLWIVRREEQVAEARLQTVHRLADVKHLADYRAEAELLWPARAERVPDLESWLLRARKLLDGLSLHRATLAELRASAEALPDGGYHFDTDAAQWQHDTLAALITGIEEFGAHEVPELERRLEFARSVSRRSIEEHQADWSEATASIADRSRSPWYGGLKLTPQVGLVPLGPDPRSGLAEFAHLESGEVPIRGADGGLQISEASAVVLVLLPAGRFSMGVTPPGPGHPLGSPNVDPDARPSEGPVHSVDLSAFFLSKDEMTQGQWVRATGINPSAYQAGQVVGERMLTLRNPVEQVSWADATQVLGNWGLVLPTEAQWEYGARGGTETVYWEGSRVEDLQGAANLADRYCRNHGGPASWVYEEALDDGWVTHAPVGLFRPNPFGLYDMQGNVWEWCQDHYGPYTLPVAAETGERQAPPEAPRVFRGGGFRSSAVHARSGDRYSLYYNGSKAFDVGVRPARRIDP